jgi:hypothetical protein
LVAGCCRSNSRPRRNAALSLEGRDIGELPPVLNPDRKEQASRLGSLCLHFVLRTVLVALLPGARADSEHLPVVCT